MGKTQAVGSGKAPTPPPTLETFAELKRLPVDFLQKEGVTEDRRGIRFPYRDTAGAEVWHRTRVKLTGKNHTMSPKGHGKSWPQGCDRLKWEAREEGRLYVVEGESDFLTGRLHGLPILGIPGATQAAATLGDKLTAENLAGVDRYLVVTEPDAAGAKFPAAVAVALRKISAPGDVLAVRLPVKDLSALHLEHHQDAEAFRQALAAAVAVAEPVADGRVEIEFGDIHQTADEIIAALTDREANLYQRGGALVKVVAEKVRADGAGRWFTATRGIED